MCRWWNIGRTKANQASLCGDICCVEMTQLLLRGPKPANVALKSLVSLCRSFVVSILELVCCTGCGCSCRVKRFSTRCGLWVSRVRLNGDCHLHVLWDTLLMWGAPVQRLGRQTTCHVLMRCLCFEACMIDVVALCRCSTLRVGKKDSKTRKMLQKRQVARPRARRESDSKWPVMMMMMMKTMMATVSIVQRFHGSVLDNIIIIIIKQCFIMRWLYFSGT